MTRHEDGYDEDWDCADDDSSDDLYVDCPECGADVYEDAGRCPRCGHYLTTASRTGISPLWQVVAVVVLLVFLLGILSSLLA